MLRRTVLVLGAAAWLGAGCATSQETFTGPSGGEMHEAKCGGDASGCYESAAETCGGGEYQVLDSRKRSGGIVTDALPGPVTWYYLTFACGPSNGMVATFPQERHDSAGIQAALAAGSGAQPARQPRNVSCSTLAGVMTCNAY